MNTKFYYILTALFLVGIFTTSCNKDETNDLIESNGLSRAINDFIPQDILDILDSLGMPINTGGNPANIEGAFLFSKSVLVSSNIESDNPGSQFNDIMLSFLNQNNEELTLTTEYIEDNTSQEGAGYGSFIVGDGDFFSVFAKNKTYDSQYNDSVFSTFVFSGKIETEGIEDLHIALVVLDDYGDPNNHYIPVGSTRVFHDEDGFSERTEDVKSSHKNIFPISNHSGLLEPVINDR
jgi:hypothetical protein